MSNEQRLRQLEDTVATLAHTVDLSVSRIGWLTGQSKQTATDEELAELERVELLAIFEIAEKGGPVERAMAMQVLEALGCAVPDSPAELMEV